MARLIVRIVTAAATLILCTAPVSAQKLTGPSSTVVPPAPVALDTTGMFQAKYVSVGADVFIGGQPTERALRALRAQGVMTVVNLRTPAEMVRDVPFNEDSLVKSLGMTYVYIPMRGNAEYPYSPEALETFARAMSTTQGKLLLHCTVAWRASHLWAAYLIGKRNVPADSALRQTRMINLMDDHRMDGERQPLEQFLGRAVPEMGHGTAH